MGVLEHGRLRGTRFAFAATMALAAAPAAAEEGEGMFMSAVTDPTVKTECSACHMAYPAAMLPAESWDAIMANLSDHFGEDASLAPETAATIRDWLTSHAAPSNSYVARAAVGNEAPGRITETAWWVGAHNREVPPSAFRSPKVGSPANCAACHRGAEQGFFGDD